MAGGQNTFVSGNVLTAAQVNSYLMDQAVMRVTSGTRPTAAAQGGALLTGMKIFETDTLRELVYNGSVWVTTTSVAASVTTSETTASTSYTALATAGPAVTVTTGTKALVTVSCGMASSVATSLNYMGYAVSGASTIAAADTNCLQLDTPTNTAQRFQASYTDYITNLTAGSNTFTAQYRVNSNTGTFVNRRISVTALP